MDNLSDTQLKWLNLHLIKDVGPKTFARLLDSFGSIEGIYQSNIYKLASIKGISQKKAEYIYSNLKDFAKAEKELADAKRLGVDIMSLDADDYPKLLKQIDDPPHILYKKGSLVRQDNLAIAIVGSRTCSQYGFEQASRFAHLLASSGFTIISGLARGIDTAAHRGAIAAGGRTIAVQGRGLAGVFPPENAELANNIVDNGALISELPVNFEPIGANFPARNRIIAGMSLATIVIEAKKRGGALITARLAMEYNRDVMAVPGRIDNPCSEGPNSLIRDGATLITGIDDIMEVLGTVGDIIKPHAAKESAKAETQIEKSLFDVAELNLNGDESDIYNHLSKEPVHIDSVVIDSGRSVGKVNAALTALQLKGLVKQHPGNYFTVK